MKNTTGTKIGCGLIILVVLLNICLGGWSVNEILSWFGKSIPFWADSLIGLFTGEFSIPVAVVGKILIALGVF